MNILGDIAKLAELKTNKDMLLKTKDGLLQTEDVLLKMKDGLLKTEDNSKSAQANQTQLSTILGH